MPNTPPNLIAGGTIRPSRFVKISDDHEGSEADANERVIGISGVDTNLPPLSDLVSSSNHATIGQQLKLFGEGDVCLLEYGDTVTAGTKLKSDADGKGVPIATTGTTIQNIGAIALQDGAAGTFGLVAVQIYSERPALM